MRLFALGLVLLGTASWAAMPQSKHIWIITEENHSYEAVIGNSNMPYFNSLARKYGLAKEYYAEQHNSLSALMWLVAGQPITGNDQTTSCYNVDNIARHLIAHGLKWRSYQEDLPYAGFTGLSNLDYVRRHNPIIDFTDTCNSQQALNSVPFARLAKDISDGHTPNYAYVTPNLQNDAHNGTLAAADDWLSQHVPKILHLPEFQPGGDGILFIVWDEADLSGKGGKDDRCAATISRGCGGRLATLVIGPQVRPHYASTHRYDHANLLRTVCDAMGFKSCPGAAEVANPMEDFFNTVEIDAPFPDAKVVSPVRISAKSVNDSPVVAMQIYVDQVLRYRTTAASFSTKLPMNLGSHHLTVRSWDAAGGIHKRDIDVDVQTQAVMVTDPAPNAVVGASVPVSAIGDGSKTITKMQLYIDGNAHFQSSGDTLNTKISLAAGPHTLAVEATDSSGNLIRSKVAVTAASPSVKILSPAPKSKVYAPLYVSAKTIDPVPVTTMQIYVDQNLAYQFRGTGVQARLPLSVGSHSVVVRAWNASGDTYHKSVSVDIMPVPIKISSPLANATVSSPVKIAASAPTNSPVKKMSIYVDHVLKYKTHGTSVSHSLSLSSGKHYLVVKGWDEYGNGWGKGEYIQVK